METITITLELTPEQARALNRLCDRLGWSELRELAVSHHEAHEMTNAVYKIAGALAVGKVASDHARCNVCGYVRGWSPDPAMCLYCARLSERTAKADR